MALADIWRVNIQINLNKRASSINLYYRETSLASQDGIGNQVCVAAQNKLQTPFENCLGDQVSLPRYRAWRINQAGAPGNLFDLNSEGQSGTEPLPSNKAMVIRFFQNVFPAKHNNRVYIPGVALSNTSGNNINPAFVAGAASLLRDALVLPIDDGDPLMGEWTPVAWVNQDQPFNIANYPFITGAVVHPIIYSQAPRTRRDVFFG